MAGRFFITCTGGAEGKCVRFGYKPWRQVPRASLAPYYQTCVRLVRADYCGDGTGHTRNGTPIDIFDKIGIQRDEAAPGLTFEAAWGPDGAVCVPAWAEIIQDKATPQAAAEKAFKRVEEIFSKYPIAQT